MPASAFVVGVKCAVSGTPGTGAITLGAAVAPFFGAGELVDGGSYPYYIVDGNNIGHGEAVYTASGTSLARDAAERCNVAGTPQSTPMSLTSAAVISFGPRAPNLAKLNGWTQIAQIATTSGSTADFTSIPQTYNDLLLVFSGVSHNNGSNTQPQHRLSNDNGSSYTTAVTFGASIAASAAWHGSYLISDYRLDVGMCFLGVPIQASSPSTTSSTPQGFAWNLTGGINAIRIQCTAGSFDAGTLTLYGR